MAGFAIICVILSILFRKNTVTKEEAEKENPTKFLGMDVFPRRNEGVIKIPLWVVVIMFLFFGLHTYYYLRL